MTDIKHDWDRCPICKGYGWMNHHKCPPMWQVVPLDELPHTHDDLEYWSEVYAASAREAAEKYVERNDRGSAEFSEIAFIVVRDPEEPDTMTYHQVDGELVRSYEAATLTSLEDARTKFKEWFTYDPIGEGLAQ